MKKETYTKEEIVAVYLKMLGHKPSWSQSIVEQYTCGYGYLDFNGFWQFPLWDEAVKAENEWEEKRRKSIKLKKLLTNDLDIYTAVLMAKRDLDFYHFDSAINRLYT